MGNLNALVELSFKQDKDGRIVFYPYGKMGAGYIVNNEQKIQLKRFISIYYLVCFLLIPVAFMFVKFYALFILLLVIPIYPVVAKKMSKGMERTQDKLRFMDSVRGMAILSGTFKNIVSLSLCLLMTAANLYLLIYKRMDLYLAIAGLVIFGFGSICYLYYTWHSIKHKKHEKD